jgi:hypothetical protein
MINMSAEERAILAAEQPRGFSRAALRLCQV